MCFGTSLECVLVGLTIAIDFEEDLPSASHNSVTLVDVAEACSSNEPWRKIKKNKDTDANFSLMFDKENA